MGLLSTKIGSSTITNMCGFLQNKKESDTFFVQVPAFVLNFLTEESLGR